MGRRRKKKEYQRRKVNGRNCNMISFITNLRFVIFGALIVKLIVRLYDSFWNWSPIIIAVS